MSKEFFKRVPWGAVALVLGLVMVSVGVLRGEPRIVLNKAIRICLECIGIG